MNPEKIIHDEPKAKEKIPVIKIKTLTTDELENIINKGSDITKERFKNLDDGGVFTFFYNEDVFDPRLRDRNLYTIAEENSVIVGIGKLTKRQEQENLYEIASVSVDSKYQNRGYAKKILEEIFRTAKQNGWTLVASSYKKFVN